MFTTARTTAKTLLVAASAASFVALGAGIAGADTLGGLTDGLPLGDLGSHVPATLTEGVSTPLGDLVKVQPGQISAQPDAQHQSAPQDAIGHAVGDSGVSAPVTTGEDNAATLGPLDLGTATDSLPLSQGSDPLGMVGGLGLLEGLGLGGGTLPLSHGAAAPAPLQDPAGTVASAVDQVGSTAEVGAHEVGSALSGLDAPVRGGTLPLAAADTPVGPVNSTNTDLTGGAADLVSDLILSDVLPMSAPVGGPLDDAVGGLGLPELPAAGEALPLAAPATTAAVGDLVSGDALANDLGNDLGNDLVGVRGLPELGEPTFETGRVSDLLPAGTL